MLESQKERKKDGDQDSPPGQITEDVHGHLTKYTFLSFTSKHSLTQLFSSL